jgi:hypothetical protein
MIVGPPRSADVAELVATAAGYVIAAFALFHHKTTPFAPPELKVVLQHSSTIFFALAFVLPPHACEAVLHPAHHTDVRLFLSPDVALALLVWTESLVSVIFDLIVN